jgi:hypothetical protein
LKKTFGLVITLALVTLAALPAPAPADLQCSSCSGSHSTITYTATAATCARAKEKIEAMATDLGAACTGANEIPCNPQLVVDVPCFTTWDGKKQVSAHLVYGCATCVEVPCCGGTN